MSTPTAPATTPEAGVRRSTAGRVLVLVAIVALAFNLRPAAVSVGPVLGDIRTGLGLTGAESGLLTSLPVIAFAVFGALAPRVARLVGPHRMTLVALLAVVGGLAARAATDSVPAFLALSLLALAGMATANVLLPSLVKQHFPDRVGLVTAVYSTSLAIGLTAASAYTVPISDAHGGWRAGLLAWSFTAAVAAVPWLALVVSDRRPAARTTSERTVGLVEVARTRLGWLMALFFGLQSLQAYSVFGWFALVYRDAGFSEHDAGLLLGLVTGTSIPLSFAVPALAARFADLRLLVTALMVCYPIGYLGLVLAPHGGAVVWAVDDRHRDLHVPADPHPDRAEGADSGRHGRPLRLHPGHRVPDRSGGPVRRGRAPRPLRRLDRAAAGAAGAERPPARRGPRGRSTGVRRGPAAREPDPGAVLASRHETTPTSAAWC